MLSEMAEMFTADGTSSEDDEPLAAMGEKLLAERQSKAAAAVDAADKAATKATVDKLVRKESTAKANTKLVAEMDAEEEALPEPAGECETTGAQEEPVDEGDSAVKPVDPAIKAAEDKLLSQVEKQKPSQSVLKLPDDDDVLITGSKPASEVPAAKPIGGVPATQAAAPKGAPKEGWFCRTREAIQKGTICTFLTSGKKRVIFFATDAKPDGEHISGSSPNYIRASEDDLRDTNAVLFYQASVTVVADEDDEFKVTAVGAPVPCYLPVKYATGKGSVHSGLDLRRPEQTDDTGIDQHHFLTWMDMEDAFISTEIQPKVLEAITSWYETHPKKHKLPMLVETGTAFPDMVQNWVSLPVQEQLADMAQRVVANFVNMNGGAINNHAGDENKYNLGDLQLAKQLAQANAMARHFHDAALPQIEVPTFSKKGKKLAEKASKEAAKAKEQDAASPARKGFGGSGAHDPTGESPAPKKVRVMNVEELAGACRRSQCATRHRSHVIYVTGRRSQVTGHMSYVTGHRSQVAGHRS